MENINNSNYKTYLDKIFQIEIPLPKYEKEIIGDYLITLIENRISQKYKNGIKDAFGVIDLEEQYSEFYLLVFDYITTFRDVIRFTNSFTLIFNKLEGEVKISDLFVVELVKLKFISIYELFANYNYLFLKSINNAKDGIENLIFEIGENKNSIFYNYLLENKSKYRITEEDISLITKTFNSLFPIDFSNERRGPLSITYPQNIDKYFFYRLSKTNLSENEFNKLLISDNNEIIDTINKWNSDNLGYSFLDRIYRHNYFETLDIFKKVINFLYIMGNSYDKKYEGAFQLNYEKLIKFFSSNEFTFTYLFGTKTNYHDFLKSTFENDTAPYFVWYRLLYYLNNYETQVTFIIEKQEREEILIKALKSRLENRTNFDDSIWDLLNLNTFRSNTTNSTLFSHSRKIIIDFILKVGINDFLDSKIITQATPFSNTYRTSDRFKLIYSTQDEFINFLSSNNIENESTNEMILFLDSLSKSKDFFMGVEFKFENLKPYHYD